MNVLIAFIDFIDAYAPKFETFLNGMAVAGVLHAAVLLASIIYG